MPGVDHSGRYHFTIFFHQISSKKNSDFVNLPIAKRLWDVETYNGLLYCLGGGFMCTCRDPQGLWGHDRFIRAFHCKRFPCGDGKVRNQAGALPFGESCGIHGRWLRLSVTETADCHGSIRGGCGKRYQCPRSAALRSELTSVVLT